MSGEGAVGVAVVAVVGGSVWLAARGVQAGCYSRPGRWTCSARASWRSATVHTAAAPNGDRVRTRHSDNGRRPPCR